MNHRGRISLAPLVFLNRTMRGIEVFKYNHVYLHFFLDNFMTLIQKVSFRSVDQIKYVLWAVEIFG